MNTYFVDDPAAAPGIVTNRHQREIEASIHAASELFETLASPDDRVWPTAHWEPLLLDHGLAVGSRGGHGQVRYRVEEYEPGRRLQFRFEGDDDLVGDHELRVDAVSEHTVRWTHILRLAGPLTPLLRVVVALHDVCLEDLLDRVQHELTGRAVARPWQRRLASRIDTLVERRAEPASVRRHRRPIALATAGTLAGIGALHVAWGLGASWPRPHRADLAATVIGGDRVPGWGACTAVAAALFGLAAATAARVDDRVADGPPTVGVLDAVVRTGAGVLALRAAAGFATSAVGIPGGHPRYRRLDLSLYSPLCAALAVALAAVTRPTHRGTEAPDAVSHP